MGALDRDLLDDDHAMTREEYWRMRVEQAPAEGKCVEHWGRGLPCTCSEYNENGSAAENPARDHEVA